jgi:hypothetical protein
MNSFKSTDFVIEISFCMGAVVGFENKGVGVDVALLFQSARLCERIAIHTGTLPLSLRR